MNYAIKSKYKNIYPYIFKGLKGRYGHWPSLDESAKRTFVVVYGQHASLERIEPIILALSRYGDVYAVDNPGFGGMDSPYKIKREPTLSFYAEHLSHFIDQTIPKNRQLTILGISFGFQVATTLLAEYPEIAKRTELAISFVGFVKYDNLQLSLPYRIMLLHVLGGIGYTRPGAKVLDGVLRPRLIRSFYKVSKPLNVKLKKMPKDEVHKYADEQAMLWLMNDHRTHSHTGIALVKSNDLTKLRVNTKLIHVGVPNDHLLNNTKVKEQVKHIYKDAEALDLHLENHAPIDLDTPDKVIGIMPTKLKEALESSINKTAVTQ